MSGVLSEVYSQFFSEPVLMRTNEGEGRNLPVDGFLVGVGKIRVDGTKGSTSQKPPMRRKRRGMGRGHNVMTRGIDEVHFFLRM